MPYANIYITMLGADPVELGVVNSFAYVMSAFVSVPVGWLQDRYSLRKTFLIGVAMSLIATSIFALAGEWVVIIPAMFLFAFAGSIGSCLTICDVSISDEDRSMCKGVCDGIFAAPSLLAPTLAALIITYFGGIEVEGIRPLYWIHFAAAVSLFLVLTTQVTEIDRPKLSGNKGFFEDFLEVFRKGKATWRWIVFAALRTFSTAMLYPFTQVFAHEIKGADQFILGAMITSSLLVQIMLSGSLGSLAGRVGRKRLIFMMEPLYWISMLTFVFAPSPIFLIFSSLLGGFRMITEYVCITPLMVNRVPIQHIGRWRGITGFFQALVSIPAPIIGGVVWGEISPSSIFILPLLASLVSLPILSTIPEKD